MVKWCKRFIVAFVLFGVIGAGLLWTAKQCLPWYRSRPYRALIEKTAGDYKIDSHLLYALIWRESRFDPDRIGQAGELGLMQITPGAAHDFRKTKKIARELTPNDLLDPGTNLMIGAWYFARALNRWSDRDDPVPFALAEYNAGLSTVRRWMAVPGGNMSTGFVAAITYPTTRAYIETIGKDRYRWWNTLR